MSRELLLSLVLSLILVSSTAAHADFTGPVVSVLDGDTIEVLHNTHPEHIRDSGIDCPEKGQAFGTREKQAASALVFGRDVLLQTHGQDKYGRPCDAKNREVRLALDPLCFGMVHWKFDVYRLGSFLKSFHSPRISEVILQLDRAKRHDRSIRGMAVKR